MALRNLVARTGLALACALSLGLGLACGGGGGSKTTTAVPSIAQIANQEALAGDTATFTATVNGTPAPTLQWQIAPSGTTTWSDVTTGSGGTTATYTTPALALSDNGNQYRLVAKNSAGTTSGTAFSLAVYSKPAISKFTVSKALITLGDSVTLSYTFEGGTGSVSPTVGNVTSDGTSSVTPPLGDTTYTLTVSNGHGTSKSGTVKVTAVPAPAIPTIQASTDVTAGKTYTAATTAQTGMTFLWGITNGTIVSGGTTNQVTFTAGTTGTLKLGCTASNEAGANASSETSLNVAAVPTASLVASDTAPKYGATVTLTPTFPAGMVGTLNQGINSVTSGSAITTAAIKAETTYTLTVTNAAADTVTSSVTLTPQTVAVAAIAPAGKTVTAGDALTFSSSVSGALDASITWTASSGAMNSSTGAWTAPDTAESCTITASSTADPTKTASTTVTVVALPVATITAPSTAETTVAGLIASVPEQTGATYAWTITGGTITAGNGTHQITFTAGDIGTLSLGCTVTNAAGKPATGSTAITVNAYTGPRITQQPTNQTVTAPDGATFTVTATGKDLTYQWYQDDVIINGATNNTYTTAATHLHMASAPANYKVIVTDGSNTSATSDSVTYTIKSPIPIYAGDPTVTDTSRIYTVVSSKYCTAPADTTWGSFRVGYDTTLLNPVWSSACFFTSPTWYFKRPSSYPTDDRIPGSLSDSDYSNTGYSRGHMTGFADLRDVYGEDAGKSTMYMSNMCPTVQVLNGGVWGNLEELATKNLTASFGRVWVYTGPIFSTKLVEPVGSKKIPIPTAFYKVIVRETAPGSPKALALIVPHSSTVSSGTTAAATMTNSDLWKFVTTVDKVQELTGLNFFPSPSSPLPTSFTATVDVTGWGNGLEQGPNKPNVHMIQPSWDSTFTHVHNSTGVKTTINITTAAVNEAVPFSAQVTPDPDAIVSTSWNFGDGSSPDTSNLAPTHAYSAAGNYTVTFTATDSQNHSSSVSRIVTIK